MVLKLWKNHISNVKSVIQKNSVRVLDTSLKNLKDLDDRAPNTLHMEEQDRVADKEQL